MAVYWLDPYIDANIGGIHGTLDTTTRNGTYSYPFGLRDFIGVNTTSTLSGGNKQSVLANGDELRIKGLANWTDFCIDLGSNWYYDGTWLRDNVGTENSDITSYLSSHPIAHGTRPLSPRLAGTAHWQSPTHHCHLCPPKSDWQKAMPLASDSLPLSSIRSLL